MATTTKSTKNIPNNYTLRKQIGSNVFRRQPKSNFQYGNFLSEYYKNQSYYYYGNPESPYIAKTTTTSSSGGGAGGSGGADVSSGVPPWINNPNKSETEQAWDIIRAEFSERFNNFKNWIAEANENGFKSENVYGITMKDITDFIPQNNQELFTSALNIMKDPSSSYADKQTAMNTMSYVVGVAEKEMGNNVVYTDPVTGQSYTWNDYLGNPQDQASWKIYSGDLEYSIYMLLETPYLINDPYQRSVLEATLTTITNGNPMSIQQGNKTIDVLEQVLTPENLIKVEEQKYYAGALQELKAMDTSGMNKYQLADHEKVINIIQNKGYLDEYGIKYVQENSTLGNYYDSVKQIETDITEAQSEVKKQVRSFLPPRTPNPDKIADDVANAMVQGLPTILTALEIAGVGKSQINESTVTNIDQGLFPTNMNDMTKEQREAVMERANLERKEGYAEQSKGNSLFDKVYGFFGDVLSTRVDPITQSKGGTDPLSNQYNPAFYQGYTAQMTSGLGNTPQEKSANQSSAGIQDYYNTRNDPSRLNIGNSLIAGNDAYTRSMFGVNSVGDIEAPTIGDYAQLGLTIYDILTLGVGRGALFGITNLGKGAGVADDGAKATRSFFSIFKKSADKADEVEDVATRLAHYDKYGNYNPAQGGRIGQLTKDGREIIEDLGDNVRVRNIDGSDSIVSAKNIPEVKTPGKSYIPSEKTNVVDNKGRPLSNVNIWYGESDEVAEEIPKAASQGAGQPRSTYKPNTTSGTTPTGTGRDWSPGGIAHAIKEKSLNTVYGTITNPIPTLAGLAVFSMFRSFFVADTLQQNSQYLTSALLKNSTAEQWGAAISSYKSYQNLQTQIAYANAKFDSKLLNTPVLGTLLKPIDNTLFIFSRSIVAAKNYDTVQQTNAAYLMSRGICYPKNGKPTDWRLENLVFRDSKAWQEWYKKEGIKLADYELKKELEAFNKDLKTPERAKIYDDYLNNKTQDFTGQKFEPFSNIGVTPVSSATTNFNDLKKEDLSPQQQIAFDVLKSATDVSQVEKVAKDLGIDYSGRLNFSTDKSVEGQKMALLNTIGENENSPFTIDRRDKNIYAPPMNQERSNYFTKVTQPETIKWGSKYVPQAATYGGQGAFNYQPQIERPWLDQGESWDSHKASLDAYWNDVWERSSPKDWGSAEVVKYNGGTPTRQWTPDSPINTIPWVTPQTITQPSNPYGWDWWNDDRPSPPSWDFAELIAIINYDPMPKKNILELAEDK